jgi:hypothetical protein
MQPYRISLTLCAAALPFENDLELIELEVAGSIDRHFCHDRAHR